MLVRVPPGEAILFFGMKSKNLGALLGLAWSFFRKTFFVFIIYIENGVYRRIGKKWPEFLTTLVHTLDSFTSEASNGQKNVNFMKSDTFKL